MMMMMMMMTLSGASVNSTDSGRLTALHLAAQEGCVDCVKLLLQHSADISALSRHGDAPLSLAARYGLCLSVCLSVCFISKVSSFTLCR